MVASDGRSDDRTATRQRLWRRSIVAGIVTAILVLVGGVGWAVTYEPSWTAKSTLLVLPSRTASQSPEAASYYDTLSQGQIVETFAQVLRGKSAPPWVAKASGLPVSQVAGVKVAVTAVPSTSVISITAQGADSQTTEKIVHGLANKAPHELNVLQTPYRATAVDKGDGSAQQTGIDTPMLLAAVVAVAALAGVGAQQLTWLLGNASIRAAQRDRYEGSGFDTTGMPIVRTPDEGADDPVRSRHRSATNPRALESPRRSTRAPHTNPNPVSNGSGGTTGRLTGNTPRDSSHPYMDS